MHYEKKKNRLDVVLNGNFNLNSARKISELLKDRSSLTIDLKQAHFVNSKAIIFLHELMHRNPPVEVMLKNPPKIFFELLTILGLQQVWNLDDIIEP